ncbi:hypothetical protein DB346_08270 [Verrucomicrobia bacterium LW23]|nr:hypothetical protein DB346_08270 [Verrucomicrobia bacterium LW23]
MLTLRRARAFAFEFGNAGFKFFESVDDVRKIGRSCARFDASFLGQVTGNQLLNVGAHRSSAPIFDQLVRGDGQYFVERN